MIIEEILFNNFRCFYGQQKFRLADGDGKHVTIVHAQNGSGKTSLLNCLMWALFGKTTAGFDQITGGIANDEHVLEGGSDAWVEVTFRSDKSQYRARRFFNKNLPPREQSSKFKIWKMELDGNNTPVAHPENFIESIIPSSMAEYFFFDGEKALSIASPSNSGEISRAIRNILGCSIAEVALEDLKEVQKRYRDAMAASYTDDDLSAVSEKLEGQIKTKETLERQVEEADAQINIQETRIADIQHALRNEEDSAKIQKQIESYEKQEKRAIASYKTASEKLARWPDVNALPLVSPKLIDSVSKTLSDQKVEHKIPDKYQKPVIEQLLSEQSCICGRALEPGSGEFSTVESLLKESADSSQIERYTKVQATLIKWREKNESSQKELMSIINEQTQAELLLAEAQQRLKTLSKNFRGIDNESLQDKKTKEENAKKELRAFMQSVANAKVGIEDITRQIRESRKFLEDAEKKSKINKKLQFKRDFAVTLTDEIEKQLNEHVELAIKVITASVNKFLSRAAAQEMKFSLDKNFKITVLINGLRRPLSEGQQQLVGLVFLGALIDFCKVRKNAQTPLLLRGATAPLILDAPFSKLDDEYMPEVARVLPEMAEQLVMMLSGSQSRPEVMSQFENSVGKQYIINRHNKGAPGEDAKSWDITIGGVTYTRNKFHESQNSSFIEEVE